MTVDVNGGEAMDVVLSDVNDDDDSELRVSVNDRNYVVRYMCDGPETQIFTEVSLTLSLFGSSRSPGQTLHL